VIGLFNRKSRQRAPLPPDVEGAVSELARICDERPELAELAVQLNACLRAAYADAVEATAPRITSESAAEKLSAGIPLLRGESLDLDRKSLVERWQRIVAALKPYRPDAAPALAGATSPEKLDLVDLAMHALAGQPHAIHEKADSLGLDVSLTSSVLWLTLFPSLVSIRSALEPSLRAAAWNRGYCPACGSYPKLGEFRGLEQIRWLRCGLCAAQWELSRLRCPYCDNRDHQRLGYLHVQGEEGKYRAATCDQCRRYTKMCSTLTPMTPPQVLANDLATVHLDLLAADRGYGPPE
jgi:FdhE protein